MRRRAQSDRDSESHGRSKAGEVSETAGDTVKENERSKGDERQSDIVTESTTKKEKSYASGPANLPRRD